MLLHSWPNKLIDWLIDNIHESEVCLLFFENSFLTQMTWLLQKQVIQTTW